MTIAIPFFCAEITASQPGSGPGFQASLGWLTAPWLALTDVGQTLASTGTIYASDVGYRTLPSDPNPTQPYPPYMDQAFAMSRAMNLDPTQSGAAAGWGSINLTNATGEWNAIAGQWNSDSRAFDILYGYKTREDTPGWLTTTTGGGAYQTSSFTMTAGSANQVRYDYSLPATTIRNPAGLNASLATTMASPSAPTLASVSSGSLAAATYYATVTYVDGFGGETLASNESTTTLASNKLVVVDAPGNPGGNAAGWNCYLTNIGSGSETKQNGSAIAFGTNWTLPSTGVVAGSSAPITATAITQGTAPTYWLQANAAGLYRAIINKGTENGVPFVDCQFGGSTTTAGQWMNIQPDTAACLPVTAGQTLVVGCYMRQLTAPTNIAGARIVVDWLYPSGAVWYAATSSTVAVPSGTLGTAPTLVTGTFVMPSGATGVNPYFQFLNNASNTTTLLQARFGGPFMAAGTAIPSVTYPPTLLNELPGVNLLPTQPSFTYTSPNSVGTTTAVAALMSGAPLFVHTRNTGTTDTNCGYPHITGSMVTGGATYTASLYVYIPSSYSSDSITLDNEGTGGAASVYATAVTPLRNAWQRLSTTFTTGTTVPALVFRMGGQTNGDVVYTTCWQIEAGGSATSYMLNGSRGGDYLYKARMIYSDPSENTLGTYFSGLATPWLLTDTELQIPIRDGTYWLERPLQTTLYLGTGGLESPVPYTGAPPQPPNTTSLQGMTKPKTRGGSSGAPVRNVTPVLVDPVNLVYQYTDAQGAVVNLYEGGATSYSYQGDVSNIYSGTTNAGYYRTCNAKGIFQLGSTPTQPITCDVYGYFPSGTLASTFGSLVYHLLTEDLNMPSSMINAASFNQTWQAGYYWGSEATIYVPFQSPAATSTDGVTAVTQLLAGLGVTLIPTRGGQLSLLQLTPVPDGTSPVLSIGVNNCVSITPQALPTNLSPPPYRMRVAYQHNYTVQQYGGLSPSMNLSQVQYVQAADRYASASSNTILTNYLRPNDPVPVPTCLQMQADAQSIANNLISLWGTMRYLYQIVLPFSVGIALDMGDVVELTWPTIGPLINGALGTVVGEQFTSTDAQITYTILV